MEFLGATIMESWSIEEDFTTGFVVRLYLLLEIYLLYIQFTVDSSLA